MYHDVLYYRPLHRGNWWLILVLRLTIQCASDIIFNQLLLITIYSKIVSNLFIFKI